MVAVAAANSLKPNDTEVLKTLKSSREALSAYDVLKALQSNGTARIKAPVQVYRSLEKLIKRKLVHRIASLNAFIACEHPDHEFDPGFFRCKRCGSVTEFNLSQAVGPLRHLGGGFHVEVINVEIEGTCQACQATYEVAA